MLYWTHRVGVSCQFSRFTAAFYFDGTTLALIMRNNCADSFTFPVRHTLRQNLEEIL